MTDLVRAPFLDREDPMAPDFAVFVNGLRLVEDITQHVQTVSYESHVEMASMLRLRIENADHKFTDASIFQPGVEIDAWFGYGQALNYVGRAELIRHLPSFPSDGVPLLDIQGYDRSHRLTHHETRIGDDDARRTTEKEGRTWTGTYGTVLGEIFAKYGMVPGIEPAFLTKPLPGAKPGQLGTTLQRRDTPDSEFIRALANLAGAEFFVRYEPLTGAAGATLYRKRRPVTALVPLAGRWTAVFRRPPRAAKESYYTFRYREGEESTVLDVELEFGLPGAVTEVTVLFLNKDTMEWEAITASKEAALENPVYRTVKERRYVPSWAAEAVLNQRQAQNNTKRSPLKESELAPLLGGTKADRFRKAKELGVASKFLKGRERIVTKTVKVRGSKPGLFDRGGPALSGGDVINTPLGGGELEYTPLRIAAGGFAFDVSTDIRFNSAEEALGWAQDWLARHRDQAIVARGTLPGTEMLEAGTVHRLEGLGQRYSGDYYFVGVEHVWDADQGYVTNFTARKMLD